MSSLQTMSFRTNISFSIIGLALILFNVSTSYITDYGNSFNQDNIELVEQFVKSDASTVLFVSDNVDEENEDEIDTSFNWNNVYSFENFCNRTSLAQNASSLDYSILSDKLIRYSIQSSSFDDDENS